MNNSQKQVSPFRAVSIALTACLLYAISAGLRSNYGLLIEAIAENCSIAYSGVSFILAVGQLVFGIMQPIFGIIALRRSNRIVLITGLLLMAVGTICVPLAHTSLLLFLPLGIILPAGTGAISFGIIMGTITPKIGSQKAATVSGLVSASSGIGSTVLSPLIQTLLGWTGLLPTMLILSIPMLLLILPSINISHGERDETGEKNGTKSKVIPMIKQAFKTQSYVFITLGFFTCGFHMAIVETHVYSQFVSYGISEQLSALAYSLYGITTMLGCIISGFICSKIKMKWVLSVLYGFRSLLIITFLLLPKTIITVFGFAVFLGCSGASTVTPTSGITEKLFGAKKLATLFGVCFLAHQIGSFFSSWLGGICVEATGGYTLIWLADVLLCIAAAVVCTRVQEPTNTAK